MKTVLIYLSLHLIISSSAFSQDKARGYGQISLKDFDYKVADNSDAEAIVLFDLGFTEFVQNDRRGGFDIRFKREKKILIKNKAGLKYADIAIPFYIDGHGKRERIEDVEATTYYLVSGSLQKKALDKKDIFLEKSSENWHQKKFAFPNAVEGAIIEYKYTLYSPFIFQLPDWEFQTSIPTVHSKYTFSMIPFYEYVYLLQGASKFDSFSGDSKQSFYKSFAGIDYKDNVYTAVMNNIPAFEDESYISSVDDYLIKMDFQLAAVNNPDGSKQDIITTYAKLIKSLNGHEKFGKYLKKAEKEAKNILNNTLNLSGITNVQKAESIINYIKENYDWNGKDRKYTEHSPKEIIKQKKGSAAEINLLLVAMLKKAAIAASPVIFSTRSHGKIHKDYPFDHQFNSVLVFVEADGQKFLTDGTEPLTPFDRIPLRCMNDQGLVIKEGNETWVNMYSNIESKSTRRITLSPDPETKKLKVEIKGSFSEIEGYLYRNYYENDVKKIEERLLENGFENISAIKTENFEETRKNYKINYLAEIPMDYFDDKLLVPPFLNYPLDENLLKQKKTHLSS